MVDLSDEQKSVLAEDLKKLDEAIVEFQEADHKYGFKYPGVIEFMEGQKKAILSLKNTGTLGCDLDTVDLDEGIRLRKMVSLQHEKYLATVEAIGSDEKRKALGKLANHIMVAAVDSSHHLKKMVGYSAVRSNKSEQDPTWKR